MKLAIATPVYGRRDSATVSYGYHESVRCLERGGAVVLAGDLIAAEDVVKARMRLNWGALSRADWDWLLWWDDDVVPQDPGLVNTMLGAALRNDWKVIAAPYPRKNMPMTYPYRPTADVLACAERLDDGRLRVPIEPNEEGCVEVDAIGFGFIMTHRSALQQMVDKYREELWHVEIVNGKPVEMVSVFSMLWTPEVKLPDGTRYREQLNEDYSWCVRWRRIGGSIWMYCGEGSPLAHVGSVAFKSGQAEVAYIR